MDINLYEYLSTNGKLLKVGDFNFLDQRVAYYVCSIDDEVQFSKIKELYPNHEPDTKDRIIVLDEYHQLFSISTVYETKKHFEARKELYQNKKFIEEFQEELNTITSLDGLKSNRRFVNLTLNHSPYLRKLVRKVRFKASSYVFMLLILVLYFGFMTIQKSFNSLTELVLTPTISNILVILQILWVVIMIAIVFIPLKINHLNPDNPSAKLAKKLLIILTGLLLVFSIQSLRENFVVRSTPQTIIDKEVLEVEYLNGSKKKFMLEDSIWMRHAGEGFDS